MKNDFNKHEIKVHLNKKLNAIINCLPNIFLLCFYIEGYNGHCSYVLSMVSYTD